MVFKLFLYTIHKKEGLGRLLLTYANASVKERHSFTATNTIATDALRDIPAWQWIKSRFPSCKAMSKMGTIMGKIISSGSVGVSWSPIRITVLLRYLVCVNWCFTNPSPSYRYTMLTMTSIISYDEYNDPTAICKVIMVYSVMGSLMISQFILLIDTLFRIIIHSILYLPETYPSWLTHRIRV